MRLEKNDPRLIDFVLGELDEEEARSVSEALQAPENAESLREVEELQGVVRASTAALNAEPGAAGLAEAQRAKIIAAAEQPAAKDNVVRFPWKSLLAAAAVLLVIGALVIPNTMSYKPAPEMVTASLSQEATGDQRLRELPKLSKDEQEQLKALGYMNDGANVMEEPVAAEAAPAPTPLDDARYEANQAAVEVLQEAAPRSPGSGMDTIQSGRSLSVDTSALGGRDKAHPELDFDGYEGDLPAMASPEQFDPNAPPAPSPPPPPAKVAAQEEEVFGFEEMPISTMSTSGNIDGGTSGGGGGFGGGGRMAKAQAAPEPKAEPKPAAASSAPGGLQGVEVGGNIRARGNYYSETDVNQAAPETKDGYDPSYLHSVGLRGAGEIGAMDFESDPGYRFGVAQSGEAYAPIQENDFSRVADAPLSTFSIDVDTAAYSNVRRFLTQGTLPPPNAVRMEEMINYFDYRYPQPEGEHPFSVNVDLGACPWEPEHLIARVGIQGLDVPREQRPPANLVFLLDVSGSMSDANKLPLVKESMKALLRELDEGDRIGIVTYASDSAVVLRSTPASNVEEITAAIDSLSAGGSTRGSAGIQDAYAMAMHHFMKEGVNRVVLATDGDFNVGVTSPNALVRMIEEKRKSGVFLTALGFGMGNIKDATLEQLADKGNGNYAYIDSFAEARKVLVDELMGTLVTIAKDVKIQVEFNPGQVQAYRLLGYENRALAARDFNDDTKDAGEIGSGHQVTALYQIVPVGSRIQPGIDALRYQEQPEPETAAEPSGELMNVKLRYKKPDSDTSQKIETPVSAEASEQLSPDTKFAASVAAFGMLLRHSQYAGKATFDMVRELAEQGAQAGWFDGPKAQEMKQAREDFVNLVVTAKTLGGGNAEF
jgi:Ca-activated chloride channel family protein